ncbi:LCP family protein required for cell wall assembly [Catenulispora sp. MAP5-51]|uniref:LCP family protein n=1 Tax=Catenulispora sp. MAP5-51 TaxID=3156298 RepID=UPI003516D3B3
MSGAYGGWTPQEPGGWNPQQPGGWTPQEPEPTVELRPPSRWDRLRGSLPGGQGGQGGRAGGGGPRPPKVRRFSWPRRILAGTLVLVLLVGGYATWLYFHASGEIRHENVISDYPGRPAEGKGSNWLLVGSDSREGLTQDQQDALHTGTGAVTGDTSRTDSMMILHSGSNGTSLISLPRDSYVTIPAWTDSKGKQHKESKNKLNAAYAFGDAPLLIKTIEVTTGVRIDHFAEVGFGGFVKVTDAVGGVGMCLDKPIKDELSGANLKAGCQTLNGAQALAYVRERYADPLGDIGRMQRQRAFLAALAHKVSSAGVILNPFKLVPVLDNSLAAFKVSDGTSLGDLYDMFQSMKGVSGGSGHTIVVPIANEDYNVPGVGSSILWDKTKAAQLWSAVINDTPMPAFSAT